MLIDLVLRGCQTAITQQVCQSQLTVQLQAHLLLQPCHNVKAGNVDHIVAIQLLLLVDGGGAGGAAQQAKDLFLLEVALDVTLGASILLGQVSKHALETAERDVVDSAHDHAHPVVGLVDDAGRGVQQVILGEQVVDVVDAVGQLVTGHTGILKGSLHGAMALGGLDHLVDVLNAVLQHGLVGVLVKCVVLHGIVLLTVSLVAVFIGHCRTDDRIHDIFLFFRQSVKDILYGFFLVYVLFVHHLGFLLRYFVASHGIAAVCAVRNVFQRIAVRVHAMGDTQGCIRDDKRLAALVIFIGAVLDHLVDHRTRVTTRQNQTYLLDDAVFYDIANFCQSVRINRKSVQVSIFHTLFCSLAGRGIVELGIAVHTAGPVFQQTMPKHVIDTVMVMVVHHRANLTTALLEGILRDHQAIVALDVRFRGPAAAIVVKINHFDLQYSSLRHLALP